MIRPRFLARHPRRPHGLVRAALTALALLLAAAVPAAADRDDNSIAHLAGLQVIGHRGGNDFGPEHTMRTMRHAIAVGVDALEVDIRFTSDDQPVLMHDQTVNRTTNCTGKVDNFTLEGLNKCDAGGGQPIPRLAEALGLVLANGIDMYLHIKPTDKDRHYALIAQALQDAGLNDGSRVTAIADTPAMLARLSAAGVGRVGLVFNNPAGWDQQYPVLVAYNTPVDPQLVARAQQRGSKVISVQDHPMSLRQLLEQDMGLDGWMANHVDATLIQLGRFLSTDGKPVQAGTVSEEPSDDFSSTGLDGA